MINRVLDIGCKYRNKAVKYGKIAIKDAKNCRYLGRDISSGVKQASRLGRIQNQKLVNQIGTHSISTIRQLNKHLPGLLTAISLPTIAPSGLVYAVGKLLQKALTKIL